MHSDIRKNDEGVNLVSILWESVTEPKEAAQRITDAGRRERALRYADGKADTGGDNEHWFGAPSFKELRNRLENGWPAGVDRLMQLTMREFETASIRRRRVRGDQGDELDMQAVWRGDLSRAWMRTRRKSRAGGMRTVSIVCNLGGSAGTSSTQLFWRGASALRLAYALTEAGYNVAIYGGECGKGSGSAKPVTLGQFVEIKAADQPLDMSALAAITCMGGFFRTDLFAGIVIGCDMVDDNASSGMGSEHHDLAPHLNALGIANAIVQPKVNNKEDAEKWLEAALEQIEQPLAEAA